MFLREPKSLYGRRLQWNTRTPLFMVGLLFNGIVSSRMRRGRRKLCATSCGRWEDTRDSFQGVFHSVFVLHVLHSVNYVQGVPIPGLRTACLSRHTFSKSLILRFLNATSSYKRDGLSSSLNDAVTCRHSGNKHKYCPALYRCNNK